MTEVFMVSMRGEHYYDWQFPSDHCVRESGQGGLVFYLHSKVLIKEVEYLLIPYSF